MTPIQPSSLSLQPFLLVSLANSTATAAASVSIIAMGNGLPLSGSSTPPEWIEIPFGEVPINVDGVAGIQILNKRVADSVVADFEEQRARLGNRFMGLPMYEGHPDHPYFRKQGDTNDDAFAWHHEMQATDAALRVRTEWNPDGIQLLANKRRKSFSPHFLGTLVGRRNGVALYEPARLKSVGLTNSPNWPVTPLVNAATEPDGSAVAQGGSMNLLERLVALFNKDNIKTEDDVFGVVSRLVDAAKKAAAAQDARWRADSAASSALINAADPAAQLDVLTGLVNTALSTQEATSAQLKTDLAAAKTEHATALANATQAEATAKTQLADLRKTCATALVNAAVIDGRVLPAQLDAKVVELVNAADFSAGVAALSALAKVIKTVPVTQGVGNRDASVHSRSDQILALVNTRMADNKEDYDTAFAAIRKANPALFEEQKGGAQK